MTHGQAVGGDFDAPTRGVMPDEGAVHLHLLRHGAVADFTARAVRGHLDVPLSAEGEVQHARLVQWFAAAEPAPDVVVSSDLVRCRSLGQGLAAATGAPLVIEPRLREQSMGAWEGRTWEELTTEHGRAVNDYWDDYVEARPPDGESLADVAARVDSWWAETVAGRTSGRLAVVTHIGIVRILLCRTLGLSLDQALRFAPPAASHTALLHAAAGGVVQGIGERPWLDVASLPGPRVGAAPRIALSGSAGTGKTTLGRELAGRLGVPFLEEGMRRRLEDGLRLADLSRDALRDLIDTLWQEQCAAEDAATEGFVADRSAADYAAFWIHYGFHHETTAEEWLARVLAALPRYDRVVLLPWGVLPLADDGVRSTNRWLQLLYHSLVEKLLTLHLPASRLERVPRVDDLEQRLAHVLERIGRGA